MKEVKLILEYLEKSIIKEDKTNNLKFDSVKRSNIVLLESKEFKDIKEAINFFSKGESTEKITSGVAEWVLNKVNYKEKEYEVYIRDFLAIIRVYTSDKAIIISSNPYFYFINKGILNV